MQIRRSKEELIESIKTTLVEARKEPQFYDQKLADEIEKFIDDITGPSFDLILDKSIRLSLGALQKKGLINAIQIDGQTYYKKI